MKNNAYRGLQFMLWFAALFHLIVGAGLNLWPGMAPFMANVYGADVQWTAQFTYILKPLGVFMFVLGIIAASAALKPLKNRVVIYAFVVLFVARALQRIIYAQAIIENFGISSGRNMINTVFFFSLAAVLIVLERTARDDVQPS